MNADVVLEEERIIDCTYNVSGGYLEYDISHIDPRLDTLTQSYIVESTDYEGRLNYGSEFVIYKKGEITGSLLKDYPKETKIALWKIIFAIKWKFFEEIKPDIVLHFIKDAHSVEDRYRIYSKYFSPPGYTIDKTKFEIIYTKETSTGDGGGFPFLDN